MVDREKVIKNLEELLVFSRYNDSVEWNPYNDTETLEDAIALLKEQEPADPIPTEDDDWICGACNNSVVGTEELDAGGFVPIRFNYCPNCGQAVKWK